MTEASFSSLWKTPRATLHPNELWSRKFRGLGHIQPSKNTLSPLKQAEEEEEVEKEWKRNEEKKLTVKTEILFA